MFAIAAVVAPVEALQPDDFEAVVVDDGDAEVAEVLGLAVDAAADPLVEVATPEPALAPVPAMQAPRVTVATRLAATVAIRERWAGRRPRELATMGFGMVRILEAHRKTPPSAA